MFFLAFGLVKSTAVGLMLEGGISKAAHVPVHIGSTDLGVLSSSINLKSIRVYNPKGFPERMMLDAPQLFPWNLDGGFDDEMFRQSRLSYQCD